MSMISTFCVINWISRTWNNTSFPCSNTCEFWINLFVKSSLRQAAFTRWSHPTFEQKQPSNHQKLWSQTIKSGQDWNSTSNSGIASPKFEEFIKCPKVRTHIVVLHVRVLKSIKKLRLLRKRVLWLRSLIQGRCLIHPTSVRTIFSITNPQDYSLVFVSKIKFSTAHPESSNVTF